MCIATLQAAIQSTPLFSRENGEEDNNKSLLHAEEMMGKCLWMRKSQWFSAENKTVSMHPNSKGTKEDQKIIQKCPWLQIGGSSTIFGRENSNISRCSKC